MTSKPTRMQKHRQIVDARSQSRDEDARPEAAAAIDIDQFRRGRSRRQVTKRDFDLPRSQNENRSSQSSTTTSWASKVKQRQASQPHGASKLPVSKVQASKSKKANPFRTSSVNLETLMRGRSKRKVTNRSDDIEKAFAKISPIPRFSAALCQSTQVSYRLGSQGVAVPELSSFEETGSLMSSTRDIASTLPTVQEGDDNAFESEARDNQEAAYDEPDEQMEEEIAPDEQIKTTKNIRMSVVPEVNEEPLESETGDKDNTLSSSRRSQRARRSTQRQESPAESSGHEDSLDGLAEDLPHETHTSGRKRTLSPDTAKSSKRQSAASGYLAEFVNFTQSRSKDSIAAEEESETDPAPSTKRRPLRLTSDSDMSSARDGSPKLKRRSSRLEKSTAETENTRDASQSRRSGSVNVEPAPELRRSRRNSTSSEHNSSRRSVHNRSDIAVNVSKSASPKRIPMTPSPVKDRRRRASKLEELVTSMRESSIRKANIDSDNYNDYEEPIENGTPEDTGENDDNGVIPETQDVPRKRRSRSHVQDPEDEEISGIQDAPPPNEEDMDDEADDSEDEDRERPDTVAPVERTVHFDPSVHFPQDTVTPSYAIINTPNIPLPKSGPSHVRRGLNMAEDGTILRAPSEPVKRKQRKNSGLKQHPIAVEVWQGSDGIRRGPRDVTALDVFLDTFEKVAWDFRETLSDKVCRKAVGIVASKTQNAVREIIEEKIKERQLEKTIQNAEKRLKKRQAELLQLKSARRQAYRDLADYETEKEEIERMKRLDEIDAYFGELQDLHEVLNKTSHP